MARFGRSVRLDASSFQRSADDRTHGINPADQQLIGAVTGSAAITAADAASWNQTHPPTLRNSVQLLSAHTFSLNILFDRLHGHDSAF